MFLEETRQNSVTSSRRQLYATFRPEGRKAGHVPFVEVGVERSPRGIHSCCVCV